MKIFIKRKQLSLYGQYKKKYGAPQLTAFGEHVFVQASEKFVREAKTGKIVVRTKEIKYLGKSAEGLHFYLGPKSKLKEKDKAIPSFYE